MKLEDVLTPKQFARLGAHIGWEPEDIADALASSPDWELDRWDAEELTAAAVMERLFLDQDEERQLDDVARLSEHDLNATLHEATGPLAPELNPETRENVLAAGRLAEALSELEGMNADMVAAAVQGAFLLPDEHAVAIAEWAYAPE